MPHSTEKPAWVLLFLSGISLIPVVFLVGIAIGINTSSSATLTPDSISSWINALATVTITILTFVLAKETWQLRIAQIEQSNQIRIESIRPNVDLHIMQSAASLHLMNVHIENSGKGVARDVQFKLSHSTSSPDTTHSKKMLDALKSLGMLKKGITALSPLKERSSFLFSFLDLIDEIGDAAFDIRIDVEINYSDAEGNPYKTETTIDLSEYRGISEVGGGDPIYNLYKEIEKIRKFLDGMKSTSPFSRVNINTYTSADRNEEIKPFRDRNLNQESINE